MKKNRALLAGVVLTGVVVGTSALALGAGHGGGGGCSGRGGKHQMMGPMMGSEERLMKMADRLDLNEEQRASVKQIFAANKSTFEGYGAQLKLGREAMRNAIDSDTYDQAVVRDLAKSQGAVLGDMMALRADVMHQVRQVLTAEQVKQMEDMRGRHRRGAF
jgi:Spy/CpxP family protein refolding chaperone